MIKQSLITKYHPRVSQRQWSTRNRMPFGPGGQAAPLNTQRAAGAVHKPIHIFDPVSTYHLSSRHLCHEGGTADRLPVRNISSVFAGPLRFKEVVSQPSKNPTYDSVHGRNQFRFNDLGFDTSLSACLPTKHRPA